MSWLLDTNSCSYAIRGRFGLREAIDARSADRIHVSSITLAEAWAGSLAAANADRLVALWVAFLEPFGGRILPFDEVAAREYGRIRSHLEARGRMIGDRDCMIAAIARASALAVVTHDTAEFRRVPGLKVEDWTR